MVQLQAVAALSKQLGANMLLFRKPLHRSLRSLTVVSPGIEIGAVERIFHAGQHCP